MQLPFLRVGRRVSSGQIPARGLHPLAASLAARSLTALAAGLAALLLGAPAWADTIVLKNGRRIIGSNVTEEGEHVHYETAAGELSLPKAIVDRIERNGLAPGAYAGPANVSASAPPVEAPQVDPSQGYEEVVHGAVHDGSIDVTYLASIDAEASNGNSVAVAKVAAAHYAAAQFLLAKGDMSHAVDQYRRALIFAPANPGLLLNLAVVYLRQSQYTAAMDPIELAERAAPNSADAAKLKGWAYYGQNKIDQAVAEWKRSLALRQDPDVQAALAKAERDRQEEESYRQGETAHFVLKYYGGAAPDLSRGVLRSLEENFRQIESELDYTPTDPIGVILYTDQSFSDITRAPGWAGALNDGRIRVPVQGLTAVTPDLDRVLRHELTHSFITQKTRSRAPTWLQEGVAQWVEGRRCGDSASVLVAAYEAKSAPSFATLEGSWMGYSGNTAAFAYGWSLAAVESIIQAGGTSDISRLLDAIAGSASPEAALRTALRSNYPDLEQQTAAYLRKQYLR
jgi:tetratricopeptide (TPR) repeat protein